jgi:hypothetical protein
VLGSNDAAGGQSIQGSFDEDEKRALESIALADPRFARRLANPPREDELRAAAVKALAEGDPDVSVLNGALDFFSFTARARTLAQAAKTLGQPEDPTTRGTHLERELAERLVAEEKARLEEERLLPGSAGALVRGIVETWAAPSSPEAMKAQDARVARKLDQIRASLTGSTLPRSALIALDGALDPLERLAPSDQLPSSAGALARLRVALGDTPAASGTDPARAGQVEAGVRAHLGLSIDAKQIRGRLTRAEATFRAMAKDGATHVDERQLASRAEGLTFSEARCDGSPSASRARSLAPPPERAPVCGSLHAMADASDDASLAAALVALHDETVVALWALALHADGATPDQAAASAHPFFGAQPEREARLLRFAEARPTAAIGAGLALDLLTRAGKATLVEARAVALVR